MRKTLFIRCSSLVAVLALVPVLWTQENDAADVPEGVEVLARGPVHEAFAEPATGKPQESGVVPKAPPASIEELPPDQKPDGAQWLPGYWSWDEERNDFIWVSGFWRVPPPGRRWVPGHWKQAAGGHQWAPGFWAGQEQKEMTYLPPPPEPMDAAPSVPAPSAEHIYVPGTWVYHDTRYVWRAGFWSAPRPGWVWVPSHYVWTPGGYLFVDGYWDYTLRERGLLFAPAYINVAVIRPGWCYTPTYVIHDDCLVGALFVRRGYGCYYFGDYFEPCYRTSYTAFYEVRVGGRCCDPLFSYYSFHYRSNPGWSVSLRIGYNDCYRGVRPRPPRTLIQQNTIVRNTTINKKTVINNNVTNINSNNNNNSNNTVTNNTTNNNDGDAPSMLSPLKQADKKGMALKSVSKEDRQAERDSAKELKQVSHQRAQLETPGPGGKGLDQPRTMKMDLPKNHGPNRGNDRPNREAPPSLEGKRGGNGNGPGKDGPGHGGNGPGKDGPGKGPNGPGKDGPGKGPNGPGHGGNGPGKDGPGKDGPGKNGPGKGPNRPPMPNPQQPGIQPRQGNNPPGAPQIQPKGPAVQPQPKVNRPPERREEKKDDKKKR